MGRGFLSPVYTGPFTVTHSTLIRATAYTADLSKSVESDSVQVTILPTYLLSATTAGGGTVFPNTGTYLSNRIVTVSATPAPGWSFLNWTGDAKGSNRTISITMDRSKVMQAVFGTASINATIAGQGKVVLNKTHGPYPYGSVVRVTAMPDAGYYFALWGNAASGRENPLDFTVRAATPNVSALFVPLAPDQFSLTRAINGMGKVVAEPAALFYTNGQTVVVTAISGMDQFFLGWSGDASGIQNPLFITMSRSKAITANFGAAYPRLRILGFSENGEFRLLLSAESEVDYLIEASTNLTEWSPLVRITNSTLGDVQVVDTNSSNWNWRFYRPMIR